MSRPPETGICILSIDLVSRGAASTSEVRQTSARWVELDHLLAEAKIPVTWGIGESLETDAHQMCGEVALLADASWAAAGAGRHRFSQSLAERLRQLGSAGFSPTTLVLPQGCLATHDDLLVKQGIRVVRVSESRWQEQAAGWWPRGRLYQPARPLRALRWGLWQAQATVDLADFGLRATLRRIDRLVHRGGLAIVVAQDALFAGGREISRLVQHVCRRRDENAWRLETLGGMAAKLQATRPATSARSILHSAAA